VCLRALLHSIRARRRGRIPPHSRASVFQSSRRIGAHHCRLRQQEQELEATLFAGRRAREALLCRRLQNVVRGPTMSTRGRTARWGRAGRMQLLRRNGDLFRRIRGRFCRRQTVPRTWRQAADRGCVAWSPYPSVGGCGIRLLPSSGGAIRRNRCSQGAPRPTARASAPRPGRRSIGPRGRSRPHAGRRPPSDNGRRVR
jgi:hypothetical protein